MEKGLTLVVLGGTEGGGRLGGRGSVGVASRRSRSDPSTEEGEERRLGEEDAGRGGGASIMGVATRE